MVALKSKFYVIFFLYDARITFYNKMKIEYSIFNIEYWAADTQNEFWLCLHYVSGMIYRKACTHFARCIEQQICQLTKLNYWAFVWYKYWAVHLKKCKVTNTNSYTLLQKFNVLPCKKTVLYNFNFLIRVAKILLVL